MNIINRPKIIKASEHGPRRSALLLSICQFNCLSRRRGPRSIPIAHQILNSNPPSNSNSDFRSTTFNRNPHEYLRRPVNSDLGRIDPDFDRTDRIQTIKLCYLRGWTPNFCHSHQPSFLFCRCKNQCPSSLSPSAY